MSTQLQTDIADAKQAMLAAQAKFERAEEALTEEWRDDHPGAEDDELIDYLAEEPALLLLRDDWVQSRKLYNDLIQKLPVASTDREIKTTHQALAMPFESVICTAIRSAAATTTSIAKKYPMEPLILSEWSSFESMARFILGDVPDMPLVSPFIPASNRACTDEAQVQALGDSLVFDTLEILVKTVCHDIDYLNVGGFSPIAGRLKVFGDPDRIWSTDEFSLSKVTVEFKTPWALGFVSCLITSYNQECSMFREGKIKTKGKITRALEQIFVYMTVNRHRYGVLTTFDQTWFIRRNDLATSPVSLTSQLEISQAISCRSVSPSLTLISAWMAFLLGIEKNSDWLYASPRSSAVVKSLPKSYPSYEISYNSIQLDGLMKWDKIIGRSQTGVVAIGQFLTFNKVVFKTMDISKRPTGLAHFKREVEFYRQLEDLQGSVIPKFIAFGSIGGMLQVLVLEDVGRPISLQEFKERKDEVVSLLKTLHEHHVNHGDLRLPNIMIDGNNQVRLIDLGMASERLDDEDDDDFEVEEAEHMVE
ncbi:hypothetical protein BDR26DRAFT_864187 [Obelidium mucronatum]|nr:hypothetical protein BDR26DRAFT_864187 [Obelidium mucronatum]